MTSTFSYVQHYKKGLEYYAAGHYEQALTAIKKALILQPDFPDAYYQIARIYEELKRYPEAISMYEKLIELLPNDLEVRCAYGALLFKADDPRRGVKVLKKVLRMNAQDPRARTELFRHYLKNNQLFWAKRLMAKGIKICPEYAPFYCMMGDLLRRKKKYDKAQMNYEKCLDFDPNFESAKRGLNAAIRAMETPAGERADRSPEEEARGELVEAASLFKSGAYDQAIVRLLDLKERPGVQREASMLLGLSFVQKGLFKRARDVLHQFVQEHTPDLLVLYNLGLTANRMGRFDEAIEHLEKALRLDEEYVEALIEMGIACQMIQESTTAKEFFIRALKVERDNARPYAYLGRLAFDHGDRSKAVQFIKKAKECDAKCPDVSLVLGYISVKNERFEEAQQHLQECLARMPDHFEAHKLLGFAQMQREDFDHALESYRAAMTLNPTDPQCNSMVEQLSSQMIA